MRPRTPPRLGPLVAAEATAPEVGAEPLAAFSTVLHQNPVDGQVLEAIRGLQDGNLIISTGPWKKGWPPGSQNQRRTEEDEQSRDKSRRRH